MCSLQFWKGRWRQRPIHLGYVDLDDPEIRWNPIPHYVIAKANILDQLEGKTESEIDKMVEAEMRRLGW
jgi:hypothetical protein